MWGRAMLWLRQWVREPWRQGLSALRATPAGPVPWHRRVALVSWWTFCAAVMVVYVFRNEVNACSGAVGLADWAFAHGGRATPGPLALCGQAWASIWGEALIGIADPGERPLIYLACIAAWFALAAIGFWALALALTGISRHSTWRPSWVAWFIGLAGTLTVASWVLTALAEGLHLVHFCEFYGCSAASGLTCRLWSLTLGSVLFARAIARGRPRWALVLLWVCVGAWWAFLLSLIAGEVWASLNPAAVSAASTNMMLFN